MSIALNLFKLLSPRLMIPSPAYCRSSSFITYRNFADKPKTPSSSKHVVGTQEHRVRVRRARPADVPRVLRFVKEHARTAWPSLGQNNSQNIVLGDFVARTLAQGHSMLAEQQESKRTWSKIRGLALSTSVCPWDAALLEKCARCVRCDLSRQLMMFTAHCLRAPGLHHKYKVHTVMQVILMVPPDEPRASEIVRLLAKNALHRGRETGFPLLRFDVTSEFIERALSDLNFQKEWEFFYEVHPNTIKECIGADTFNDPSSSDMSRRNHIAVYTAFPLRK